jgi:hypothetical protein
VTAVPQRFSTSASGFSSRWSPAAEHACVTRLAALPAGDGGRDTVEAANRGGTLGALRRAGGPRLGRVSSRWSSVLACAALTVLGAGAFARHVVDGGRWADDWTYSAAYAFRGGGGLENAFHALSQNPDRPLGGLFFALTYSAFGLDTHEHLACAAALGVLLAVIVFFVVRRYLEFSVLVAFVVAGLVLLFPASDASRLWPAAAHSNIGAGFFLVGAGLTLRGFESRRRGALLHGCSLVCYAASLLTYETAFGLILFSALIYRVRVPWKQALSRGGIDAALALLLLVLVKQHTALAVQPFGWGWLHHLLREIEGGLLVASWSVLPLGRTDQLSAARVVGALLLVLVLLIATRSVRSPAGLLEAERGKWSRVLWCGIAFSMLSFISYLPSTGYTAAGPGVGNRANVLASVGFVMMALSSLMLLGAFVGSRRFQVLLICLLALAYAADLESDITKWQHASQEQQALLSRVTAGKAPLRRNTTYYAYGVPNAVSRGIPVFDAGWDLTAALQLRESDPTIVAVPLPPSARVTCSVGRVQVVDGPAGQDLGHASYGHAGVIDATTGAVLYLTDQGRCRAAMLWSKRF